MFPLLLYNYYSYFYIGAIMRKLIIGLLALCMVIIMMNSASADIVDDWALGMEKEIFGHTFEEESWYTTITNTTEEGDEVEFGVSYANMGDIEAFLITLNQVESPEGDVGVLPYQMFGMHYFSKTGQEIFIGALLAFLMVYNDTNEDGVPNPGEDTSYVIPFGVASWKDTETYPPKVTNKKVIQKGENHYQMGITYENMYAIVTGNYWATAIFRSGFIAKFSEFSVTYDIQVDPETGEMTTETFYTIGQVTELWGVFLGIPFQVKDIPGTMDDNLGIAAVHFATVFTSTYDVVDEKGTDLNPDKQKEIGGVDLNDGQGERAFSIAFQGDYDLIDEETDEKMAKDEDAYNIVLKAKLDDLILVAWQLGFSAAVFAGMAFGLSEYVRDQWTSIDDMESSSTKEKNAKGFGKQAFWYAVCFPSFDGYRVEHDPVYSAYFGESQAGTTPEEEESPGFGAAMVLTAAVFLIAVVAVKSRRK